MESKRRFQTKDLPCFLFQLLLLVTVDDVDWFTTKQSLEFVLYLLVVAGAVVGAAAPAFCRCALRDLATVPSRKPLRKRRKTTFKWLMRPVPVDFRRRAFSLHWKLRVLADGNPQAAQRCFWRWYDERPHRRHNECVLQLRLPNDWVPFVIVPTKKFHDLEEKTNRRRTQFNDENQKFNDENDDPLSECVHFYLNARWPSQRIAVHWLRNEFDDLECDSRGKTRENELKPFLHLIIEELGILFSVTIQTRLTTSDLCWTGKIRWESTPLIEFM